MAKVLFEGSIFLHQNIGGISKYITKLNYYLNKKKFESKIFCPITINDYLKKEENNSLYFVKLKKIPKFCRKLFYAINNILTILYIIYYKPDILHFSYYNNFLAKYLKIPYILTVYDLIHEKNNYQKNIIDKKKSIDNAKHIICISNKTKDDLIHHYKVNKNKISVVHLGVDKIRKSFFKKKNNKKKFILFVGSRLKYKNFINFLKAYSSSKFLKDNYDIMCFGGGDFTKEELNKFNSLGVSNKINFKTGDDSLLKIFYEKASAYITVSKSEGFGLTPFEAMSLGCPVICSDIKVFRENIKNSSQFVNPSSIKSIKLGIENVLKNESKKKKLIKAGLKIVQNFTWNKTTLKTMEIYKRIK
jgi:glycosyltransferase involved in cell wall biosynthesis